MILRELSKRLGFVVFKGEHRYQNVIKQSSVFQKILI